MSHHQFIGHKLLCHLDRLASLRNKGGPPPINVEIDLSNRCNLQCRGCHFSHLRGGKVCGDLLSADLVIEILPQLASYGIRSVTWSGGGEPLTNPDALRILRAAYANGIKQGLYTNGTMIDRNSAATIAACCEWVYVSMDEPDKRSYALRKRANKFHDAVRGIQELVDYGVTVGVGFLIDEQNVGRTADMIRLGESLDVAYVQFRPLIRWNDRRLCDTKDDVSWYAAVNWESIHSDTVRVEIDPQRFRRYGNWCGHGYDVCWWSGIQCVITPDGRVWTCCNRRGFDGSCLGDLNCHSFAEIWAKRPIAKVDENCRVMCRGHLPNLELHEIFRERTHADFP